MKNKNNVLGKSLITFKRIDKVVSEFFIYFASGCGFVFGWTSLGIIFFSASGGIPAEFVFVLRLFYFIISFLVGLKLTIFFINKIQKKNLTTKK